MGIKKALTALGVAVAVAVAPTPVATAQSESEQAYLDTLSAFGFNIYDPVATLETGYWVCSQLSVASGNDVAANLQARYHEELPTIELAKAQVVAAVLNLCPSHYHPTRRV